MSDTARMATRSALQLFSFVGFLILSCDRSADAQQMSLAGILQANRHPLTVQDGAFAGPGAAFLEKQLAEAQFVAIGEEHGTREVPQFVRATCRTMARNDLDAMAIEAGALVTAQLQLWTSQSDGVANLATFEKQHPDSIAFFNWRQEFDLLSH